GPAPFHEHRVPERMDQPRPVEGLPRMDRGRSVRRGQPRRAALPRPVRSGLRAAPAVLCPRREPGHRHRAPACLRRCASAEPPGGQGGPRAGEDGSGRDRGTRNQDLLREVDPSSLDGRRLPRGPAARSGRHHLAPRRTIRRGLTMATAQTFPSKAAAPKRSLVAVLPVAVVVLGAVAYNARQGAVSPRIANPAVTGVPRPVDFLPAPIDWLALHQVGTVVMMAILVAACVRAWRRQPGHPYVL